MKNCFPCFSCFKKKKKIVIPDRVKEPEVKIQQKDVRRRPINIQNASNTLNQDASSSNETVSQNNRFLEQAQGVGAGAVNAAVQVKDISVAAAGQVKVISAGAVEQARVISKGAFNLLPNSIQGYFGKKNGMKDHNRVVVGLHHWKKNEMEQNKIRQEKEEENRRQQYLAEEKQRQNEIRQEKEEENRRRQASESNSGGTSKVAEITGNFLTAMSSTLAYASSKALGTEQPSTSAQTQRPSTTQKPFPTQKETRPVEKKGKKRR
ncbi:unnamed protein product [Eruca vesicaria subsp. sativa]|uniref:Uncharacterized protein n=1 Tax=Eruca vesicaria subsp. sativa TaxID=29727 RepID=A0ABC8KIX7_ERUVS|nr:unnamed protein product [Eruca vesicaria subsp. sativa]